MNKILFLVFCSVSVFMFSQNPHDSITRKPALRGTFKWIISADLYEEGKVVNNRKTGEWKRYYRDKLSGKTIYENGLAVAEYWIYNDSLKPRYQLSAGMDSMNIYEYDFKGRLRSVLKHTVDPKTIFLNYSLMTDDTLFKKNQVTEIMYEYELWSHRNDMVVVTEKTAGIPNKKYFSVAGDKWILLWEQNDKGDFILGKKKDFQKEEVKSSKKKADELKKKTGNK